MDKWCHDSPTWKVRPVADDSFPVTSCCLPSHSLGKPTTYSTWVIPRYPSLAIIKKQSLGTPIRLFEEKLMETLIYSTCNVSIYIYMCVYACVRVCVNRNIDICMCVCAFICSSIYLSICLFVYRCVYLSIYVVLSLSLCLFLPRCCWYCWWNPNHCLQFPVAIGCCNSPLYTYIYIYIIASCSYLLLWVSSLLLITNIGFKNNH